MIPAPATDVNTAYTRRKYFQDMFHSLGQDWTYVIYDEAMYCKAQLIKWRNRTEFDNDPFEMGGVHRTVNFLGDIGSVIQESGFEDLLVEASIDGASVISHAVGAKAHNRGVRIQKPMKEAMNHLKWVALGDSMNNDVLPGDEKRRILEKA
ncbi:unnamed protein product [Caretta caretta]